MRFVDLFAGLGGFHVALKSLGHSCVFACEVDTHLQDLYEENFGLRPHGDIRTVDIARIPRHDVLCAGFPCQPFSKAGEQRGLDCPHWGDLFEWVVKIIRARRPNYLILENVPNLQRHDDGRTWTKMERRLRRAGYSIQSRLLSPHQLGIPQIRERVFIVGCRTGLTHFRWPTTDKKIVTSVLDVLDRAPQDAVPIPGHVAKCLSAWQKFLKRYPKSSELPSFPIWSMEFGATYPFESETPRTLPESALRRYRGSHGVSLRNLTGENLIAALPAYARSKERRFPKWKVEFIRQNRELYRQNRKWITRWLKEILPFPPSRQKLEWNCKGEERDIWSYVIQLRASGVRVKRPTTAPSLIAMTTTQVPIIAWERRYMTMRECSRLQSMQRLRLPRQRTIAYKALGNAVNVRIVQRLASSLVSVTRQKNKRATRAKSRWVRRISRRAQA